MQFDLHVQDHSVAYLDVLQENVLSQMANWLEVPIYFDLLLKLL